MVVFAPKFNEKYTKAWAHPTRGQEAMTTFFCRIASFFLLRLNIFIALWDHILRHTIWNLEFTRKPTTFGWNSKSVLEGQGFTWKRLSIYSKEPVFRIMVGRNQKIQYFNCSTLDVLQSFLIWLNIQTAAKVLNQGHWVWARKNSMSIGIISSKKIDPKTKIY